MIILKEIKKMLCKISRWVFNATKDSEVKIAVEKDEKFSVKYRNYSVSYANYYSNKIIDEPKLKP